MHEKLHVDAVIFDKDGTLMDFDAFWVTLSRIALTDVVRSLHQPDALADTMLEVFGVKDGKADINGILCKGTYQEMAHAVQQVLQEHGCPVEDTLIENMVLDAYNRNAHLGAVEPACTDLRGVLVMLKNQGKKIALVTIDNAPITRMCLDRLGIADLFDAVYTDDGALPPKPDPAAAMDLCRRMELAPDRVVMVGDTMTDVRFARNGGLKAVAVTGHAERKLQLAQHADVVLHDVSELINILD